MSPTWMKSSSRGVGSSSTKETWGRLVQRSKKTPKGTTPPSATLSFRSFRTWLWGEKATNKTFMLHKSSHVFEFKHAVMISNVKILYWCHKQDIQNSHRLTQYISSGDSQLAKLNVDLDCRSLIRCDGQVLGRDCISRLAAEKAMALKARHCEVEGRFSNKKNSNKPYNCFTCYYCYYHHYHYYRIIIYSYDSLLLKL